MRSESRTLLAAHQTLTALVDLLHQHSLRSKTKAIKTMKCRLALEIERNRQSSTVESNFSSVFHNMQQHLREK